jgi:aspartate/methionine/tyrosine aminotransferase
MHILNYPNNPTGYTPTKEEVLTIVSAIERLAEKGTNSMHHLRL